MAIGIGAFLILLAFYAFRPADEGYASSVWAPKDSRMELDLSGIFRTVEGKNVTLKDFDDRVLFLNFWATWCGPCRAEMPSMVSLYDGLKSEGFNIIAVTDEDPETVAAFLELNPYPFTILIDEQGTLAQRFNIWSVPWTLILDKNRQLVHFHSGARFWDTPEIKARLTQILDE